MNIKKIAALLMALILAMTMLLSGCGEDDKKKDDDKKEETTVNADNDIDVDASEDEEVEDEEVPVYAQPGTEGFTLEEIELALETYMSVKDIAYLNAYALSESNAILEYMLANDASADKADFEDENGYTSITGFLGFNREAMEIPADLNPNEVKVDFLNDGNWYDEGDGGITWSDEGDIEGVQYENALDYFVEKYAPDYYDVAAEAVANAYAGSDESIEFVGLSGAFCTAYIDDGLNAINFVVFIIETNTGWFLLYEI